jgi:hypothetical protein
MMSTPAGKTGFFHQVWTGSDQQWLRVSVPAAECPRIGKAFLEEAKNSMGPWFGQEYCCEFMGDEDHMFDPDLIRAMVRKDIRKLDL